MDPSIEQKFRLVIANTALDEGNKLIASATTAMRHGDMDGALRLYAEAQEMSDTIAYCLFPALGSK